MRNKLSNIAEALQPRIVVLIALTWSRNQHLLLWAPAANCAVAVLPFPCTVVDSAEACLCSLTAPVKGCVCRLPSLLRCIQVAFKSTTKAVSAGCNAIVMRGKQVTLPLPLVTLPCPSCGIPTGQLTHRTECDNGRHLGWIGADNTTNWAYVAGFAHQSIHTKANTGNIF
jgi:hypothetical protein